MDECLTVLYQCVSDRVPYGGALYEVRVQDFGPPKPEREIKENGPLPAHGVLGYAPITPRLRPKMVYNLSKAHPLRMCLIYDVMCYVHDVMCYDDGTMTMINRAYANLRHGLRQLTPIDACHGFQTWNTQHNHTGNKPAVKGVY